MKPVPPSDAARRSERITMLLENNPYPRDVRVRAEAESLVRAGHNVTVVAPRDRDQVRQEVIEGVNVIRFPLPDGSRHGAIGFILEYVVAGVMLHLAAMRALWHGATVLHLHNPPDILFPAGAIFRLAGRKVIFDHHDLFPGTVEAKFGSGAAVLAATWAQDMTYSVANHVIATNDSYAELALSRGGKQRSEVTVVRNAPPKTWTNLPSHSRPGVLDKLDLAYLGAISSQDGVEALAPILARVCNGIGPIDAHLTVIGDGDGRREFETALVRHGVADRVTFTGWIPADRVPQLLLTADVCLDPAPPTPVNEHSTMIKIAEYLAVGKPVVAYDLLETARTAQGAATLVAAGDTDAFAQSIVALARDPDRRRRLAIAAKRRAMELTWDHSERALLAAYDALRAPSAIRS
jgi:glycosyltransferase involved in cell wall biosynthesis